MTARIRRGLRLVLVLLGVIALLVAWIAWLNLRGESSEAATAEAKLADRALIERGAYLARAGNCIGCHTVRGGASFAGGRGIDTPFGVVMAPNITPDVNTGIGGWTAADFWRALHHGRSQDGRLLYPAFPYPSFTHVTRDDSDALFAYLRSVPAVEQANRPHRLRFPYGTQAALAIWRALYFRAAALPPEPHHSPGWNRGRYLVQGLGHCAACHSGRNVLGGIRNEWAGGLMPDASWYAPSLASPSEAGVQHWSRDEVVRLLKVGVTRNASVSGPMAEVVFSSTQYLSDPDLEAMAEYLATLPLREAPGPDAQRADADLLVRGGQLYGQHCAACHGDAGRGFPGLYPALAGNRAVTLALPNNLVQMIRHGGFAPATVGNPRPFGMPPFGQALNEGEIAAVATFIRQSWGNAAGAVSPLDVLRVK
jgi:mono/diheme cytochrome c family protein